MRGYSQKKRTVIATECSNWDEMPGWGNYVFDDSFIVRALGCWLFGYGISTCCAGPVLLDGTRAQRLDVREDFEIGESCGLGFEYLEDR